MSLVMGSDFLAECINLRLEATTHQITGQQYDSQNAPYCSCNTSSRLFLVTDGQDFTTRDVLKNRVHAVL